MSGCLSCSGLARTLSGESGITPILQMRKPRFREREQVEGYEGLSQASSPALLPSEPKSGPAYVELPPGVKKPTCLQARPQSWLCQHPRLPRGGGVAVKENVGSHLLPRAPQTPPPCWAPLPSSPSTIPLPRHRLANRWRLRPLRDPLLHQAAGFNSHLRSTGLRTVTSLEPQVQ